MSKSTRRDKQAQEASDRRSKRMQSGGKSKYAKKHQLAARGKHSKTSPFYVSPKQEAAALAVGASIVDADGQPVLPPRPQVARVEKDEHGVPRVVMAPAAPAPSPNVERGASP